jgi:hypothetical protein
MSDLMTIVRTREMVEAVCTAIDVGACTPTEEEMLALASLVAANAGPLAHDPAVSVGEPNGQRTRGAHEDRAVGGSHERRPR